MDPEEERGQGQPNNAGAWFDGQALADPLVILLNLNSVSNLSLSLVDF